MSTISRMHIRVQPMHDLFYNMLGAVITWYTNIPLYCMYIHDYLENTKAVAHANLSCYRVLLLLVRTLHVIFYLYKMFEDMTLICKLKLHVCMYCLLHWKIHTLYVDPNLMRFNRGIMLSLLYRINYKLIKTCNLMFSLPVKVASVHCMWLCKYM